MKESELRAVATCSLCGKKIGETGLPLFYLFTIERHGIDMQAVNRKAGLEAFLGSLAIAAVLGPDEEMTKPMMEPVRITICELCSMKEIEPAALAMFGSLEEVKKIGEQ